MESLRRLTGGGGGHDTTSNDGPTTNNTSTSSLLLTLPLSDFARGAAAADNHHHPYGNFDDNDNDDDDDDDDDGLILISLPESSNNDNNNNNNNNNNNMIIGSSQQRLTLDDLLRGRDNDDDDDNYSVYILGDTSEKDIPNHTLSSRKKKKNDDGYYYYTGGTTTAFIEPVPARLIVEGDGKSNYYYCKTLELTRVETSNTYIVIPTIHKNWPARNDSNHNNNNNDDNDDNANGKMSIGGNNNYKRQRRINDSSHSQEEDTITTSLVVVPARSIGLVPGEDSPSSCFFLDPYHLPPGHFAPTLRQVLSRWVYDPFNPPPAPTTTTPSALEEEEEEGNTTQLLFGYSIPEIAHICRTSIGEVKYAISNRIFGAEDAMVIPSLNATTSLSSSSCSSRYGMLSEEGRQTVSMAIVSSLLESDMDLIWVMPRKKEDQKEEEEEQEANKKKNNSGIRLAVLMEEIRSQWHHMEGENIFRQSSQPSAFNTATFASTNNNNNDDDDDDKISQTSPNESQSSQFGTPSQFLPSSTQREGASSSSSGELATEVIWHCLRPLCFHNDDDGFDGSNTMMTTATNKDNMPEYVQLFPDQVAKLAAHQVFLSGGVPPPRSSMASSSRMGVAAQYHGGSWPEEELLEEWSMRLPSISSTYEPRTELLRGIAICEVMNESVSASDAAAAAAAATGEDDVDDEAATNVPNKTNTKAATTYWRYFPEVALPLDPGLRIQAMFVVRDVWTLSDAVPYLEKFIVMAPGTQDEEGGGESEKKGGLHSLVADLFGRYANVIRGGSTDLPATKYVAKH